MSTDLWISAWLARHRASPYRRVPIAPGVAAIVRFVPIADADPQAVERLLDAAFGVERRTKTAYRLRIDATPLPALSMAAFEDAELAGVLQSWPIELVEDRAAVPLVLVGPVAVAPARQLGGLGRAMMARMLAVADSDPGTPPLMLVGDADYYRRFFGFEPAPAAGWRMPGPVDQRRVLARVPAGMTLPAAGDLRQRLPPARAVA